jgi:hypothetical protein
MRYLAKPVTVRAMRTVTPLPLLAAEIMKAAKKRGGS